MTLHITQLVEQQVSLLVGQGVPHNKAMENAGT
jgi:hypothetical protein